MIQFTDVSKSFGARALLDGVSFSVSRGERIGLVGRNGSGKSTLFKLILEEDHPDSGAITKPRNYHCGHLAQHLSFNEENIVKEVCLGLPPDERDEEYRAEILLSGLGFSEEDMQRPARLFSGGFQIRINLARVLLSEPNLLLLDEPTNYLDIVSARWLTRFLREWNNEMILISHDRDFLDAVTTHTMLIHRSKIRKIQGSTDKLYEQIAIDEEVYEKTRINEEKKRKEVEVFINRFRAKATKAAAVQSRIKALEKMGTKEELTDQANLDFKFTETPPFYGRHLLEVKDISFRYESAAGEKEKPVLIQGLSFSVGKGERIGVIGKNGKGKSTLLRLLAKELTPQSGSVSVHQNAAIGYFGQTNISRLNSSLTVEESIADANSHLHRTRVRGICGAMMFSGDDALKKVSVLSGGEKSRVLLGKILALPTNVLFLDEPTNHLDMESIEALTESVKEYQGAVVIVTHSELLLRELATKLIVFQGEVPEVVDGDYDYFLQKIGWEGENEDGPSQAKASAATPAAAKAPLELDKKERARLVQEKSQMLTPLKKEIDQTEKTIYKLEDEVTKANQEIILASERQDGRAIAQYSKQIAAAQRAIDEYFSKLERISAEYDDKRAYYEKLGLD